MLASRICITTAFKASHEFVGGAVEAVPLVVTCLEVMHVRNHPSCCIALFGTLHLVYGMSYPRNFASLVRYSLLRFSLSSRMPVHHLHHLHNHYYHLFSLVQSLILNLRHLSLVNPLELEMFLSLLLPLSCMCSVLQMC